jgi:hypothetical protein
VRGEHHTARSFLQPAFFWVFGDGYLQNYGLHHADTMFTVIDFHLNGFTGRPLNVRMLRLLCKLTLVKLNKSLIADGGLWLAALMSR